MVLLHGEQCIHLLHFELKSGEPLSHLVYVSTYMSSMHEAGLGLGVGHLPVDLHVPALQLQPQWWPDKPPFRDTLHNIFHQPLYLREPLRQWTSSMQNPEQNHWHRIRSHWLLNKIKIAMGFRTLYIIDMSCRHMLPLLHVENSWQTMWTISSMKPIKKSWLKNEEDYKWLMQLC